MKRFSQYKKFDLTRGEQVNYSYYIALESIFNCFTDQLEELFYDLFNKVFKFSYQIKTDIKFQQQLRSIECPAPIFIFNMEPIEGDALLIMDHKMTNMFLKQSDVFAKSTVEVENRFLLNKSNSKVLGNKVNRFLKTFSNCWQHINPVTANLKKLVSNSVKSKIMPSHETSIGINITAEYRGFSCGCRFVFSAYRLDPLMKEHYQRALILGGSQSGVESSRQKALMNLLGTEASYEIKGVLGKLNSSHLDMVNSLEKGTVLQLENDLQNNVIVKINNQPVLSAEAGKSDHKLSLKINGSFTEMKSKVKTKNLPFSKINFPTLNN